MKLLAKETEMRTFKFFAFLLALALVVFLQPTTAAPGSGPSASGHGNLTVGGELRTFSFTAVTHKNGSVTGEAQLDNRASGQKIHMAIDCLSVSVGHHSNTAVVSGIVTISDPTGLEGFTGVFAVQDNGEGSNAPARDRISLVFLESPPTTVDCTAATFTDFGTAPIEGGNILVKP
jgi:hypothetical protein